MRIRLVLVASLAAALATTACSGSSGGSSASDAIGSDKGATASPQTPPAAGPEAEQPVAAPEPEPLPEPQDEVDAFGVTMLYPSKVGGESWILADDPTKDPRFDPKETVTANEDGSWKMRSGKVRMGVTTSTGYDPAAVETDRELLADRGYMQAPNDWKNVEITGYVKVNDAGGSTDNFAWYARGGKHNDDNPCEGSSYKGGLHYDGRVRYEKESWHVAYDQGPYEEATSSIVGRWVGFKSVMRNVEKDGATAVQLELWMDEAGDGTSWSKVYELVDDGTWGGDSAHCGAADAAMPMTWGGPIATFRWDSAQDVDFKWLSVREIE
ncbi:carbohydrate-binding protein [Vulgatibacter sp.]|uniref:carbohydrate-binding protein n=1 Tax=Vulgatibacter sp. TaxID=1971226 RepID=UPI0035680F8E